MVNFISGAYAAETCNNKVPLSQQGAAVDPNKPQTAKVPQGRANLERQPLSKKGQGGLF
jgi:hypothetical protein